MALRLFPILFLSLAGWAGAAAPFPGERFSFPSADGHLSLSAVRVPSPHSKGVVVVVGGRSESWLKYGPLFRDLHAAGYTVYSYDHRGQGLSPHFVPTHAQIGHVDDFALYGRDLGAFLGEVRRREPGATIHLIGHSMGAVVIVDCVAGSHEPDIGKIVLCSPMFLINTAPWPEPVARLLLGLLRLSGYGAGYAPGEHDMSPDEPFAKNRVTSSREHWAETLAFRRQHPDAVTGGASVGWVAQAMDHAATIRRKAGTLGPETLILEAGHDSLVMPWIPPHRDGKPGPVVLFYPGSRHEILLEREPIRGHAVRSILSFLNGDVPTAPIPLDRGPVNGHISETTHHTP
jgi:lysophospholipase